jgi:hypothetical protein
MGTGNRPISGRSHKIEGIYKTGSGEVEIVQYNEIKGVTPEMLDWWWDHIDIGFKLWHREDHLQFKWIVHPSAGHVGAIHVAKEEIGGRVMDAKIRFEDPQSVSSEFDHVLYASILLDDDSVGARMLVEYESAPFGTRMWSTHWMSERIPLDFIEGVIKHNHEECENLSRFLPDLYKKEIDE